MSDQLDERFGDEKEEVEAHKKHGFEATDDSTGDSPSDDFEAHKKGFMANDDASASDDDSDDFEAHRKAAE